MTDLELAMAEFAAKQGVTVCAPVLDAKTSKELAKASYAARMQRERDTDTYERSERNAENMRYDNEGVYYIGGKL